MQTWSVRSEGGTSQHVQDIPKCDSDKMLQKCERVATLNKTMDIDLGEINLFEQAAESGDEPSLGRCAVRGTRWDNGNEGESERGPLPWVLLVAHTTRRLGIQKRGSKSRRADMKQQLDEEHYEVSC